MSSLCNGCPGVLLGDCAECAEMDDPSGGDYDEDALEEEPMDYEQEDCDD